MVLFVFFFAFIFVIYSNQRTVNLSAFSAGCFPLVSFGNLVSFISSAPTTYNILVFRQFLHLLSLIAHFSLCIIS